MILIWFALQEEGDLNIKEGQRVLVTERSSDDWCVRYYHSSSAVVLQVTRSDTFRPAEGSHGHEPLAAAGVWLCLNSFNVPRRPYHSDANRMGASFSSHSC